MTTDALPIERSRQLFENAAGAIDDVGYQVGFEDPTVFRRPFQRPTGLTPAAYRRKLAPIISARADEATGAGASGREPARLEGFRRAGATVGEPGARFAGRA